MSKSSNSNQKEDKFSYSSLDTNDTINKEKQKKKLGKFDPLSSRYPICLVWTPLPLITALIPCIGHVGICNSEGIIHDFAGPYTISIDNMAFGNPTKFVVLELSQNQYYEYDQKLEESRKYYGHQMYDFFTNNCHSFIADVLNRINYKGRNNYNMVDIWWLFSTKSKFLSWYHFFKSYFGFIIIVFLIYISYKLFKF